MFTNFCTQFIFVEILADNLARLDCARQLTCGPSPSPVWKPPRARERSTVSRLPNPRAQCFTAPGAVTPREPLSNRRLRRFTSPMGAAAVASFLARGRRATGRRSACPAPHRLLCPTPLLPLPDETERARALHSPLPLSRTAPRLLPLFRPILAESQETPPPPLFLARELLSGEISRHRPPPPDPSHPEPPFDVTR